MSWVVPYDAGPPFWFSMWGAVPFLLLGVPWLTLGIIFVFKGDEVDKSNRIAQLYGYTVCLVAVIVSLLSISAILNAAYDRANPLQSEFGGFGASMTSFEAYKATYGREREAFNRSGTVSADTMSDTSLRQRYEALAADRISSTRYRTAKTLTTSSILLVIAIALFTLHWRWVRRLNGTPT